MFVVGELNKETSTDVVIYSYGNMETAEQIYCEMVTLYNYLNKTPKRAKRPVVCYEYPGYGNHDVKEWMGGTKDAFKYAFGNKALYWEICNEANYTVYNHVTTLAPKAKIILWGRSIGSVPVCSLLHRLSTQERRNKISFTIIQSGLASLILAKFPNMYSLSRLIKGANNLNMAEGDKNWGTVVFIYGTNDKDVSIQNPVMLMKALHDGNNIELPIAGKDHNIEFSIIIASIASNDKVSKLFHQN